jgi:hypothetical protein
MNCSEHWYTRALIFNYTKVQVDVMSIDIIKVDTNENYRY